MAFVKHDGALLLNQEKEEKELKYEEVEVCVEDEISEETNDIDISQLNDGCDVREEVIHTEIGEESTSESTSGDTPETRVSESNIKKWEPRCASADLSKHGKLEVLSNVIIVPPNNKAVKTNGTGNINTISATVSTDSHISIATETIMSYDEHNMWVCNQVTRENKRCNRRFLFRDKEKFLEHAQSHLLAGKELIIHYITPHQ